jgi:hypothetical protein
MTRLRERDREAVRWLECIKEKHDQQKELF